MIFLNMPPERGVCQNVTAKVFSGITDLRGLADIKTAVGKKCKKNIGAGGIFRYELLDF